LLVSVVVEEIKMLRDEMLRDEMIRDEMIREIESSTAAVCSRRC